MTLSAQFQVRAKSSPWVACDQLQSVQPIGVSETFPLWYADGSSSKLHASTFCNLFTHAGDPLKSVLDGGLRDTFVIPGISSSSLSSSLNPNETLMKQAPNTTTESRLSRSFRVQDVLNLISILGNASLGTELRKSSAEQLLGLVMEPGLRDHMTQPQNISVMLQAIGHGSNR